MCAVAALIPEKPCQGALIRDVEIRNRRPELTTRELQRVSEMAIQ